MDHFIDEVAAIADAVAAKLAIDGRVAIDGERVRLALAPASWNALRLLPA